MIYFLFIYCIDYRRPTGYIPNGKLEGAEGGYLLKNWRGVYLLGNWRGRYTYWKTGEGGVYPLENWR